MHKNFSQERSIIIKECERVSSALIETLKLTSSDVRSMRVTVFGGGAHAWEDETYPLNDIDLHLELNWASDAHPELIERFERFLALSPENQSQFLGLSVMGHEVDIAPDKTFLSQVENKAYYCTKNKPVQARFEACGIPCELGVLPLEEVFIQRARAGRSKDIERNNALLVEGKVNAFDIFKSTQRMVEDRRNRVSATELVQDVSAALMEGMIAADKVDELMSLQDAMDRLLGRAEEKLMEHHELDGVEGLQQSDEEPLIDGQDRWDARDQFMDEFGQDFEDKKLET